MYKFIFAFLFSAVNLNTFAQNLVFSLPDRQVICRGVSNNFDYNIEGVKKEDIKLQCIDCVIDSIKNEIISFADDSCQIVFSYQKNGKTENRIQALMLKNCQAQLYFDQINSNSKISISDLMNQNQFIIRMDDNLVSKRSFLELLNFEVLIVDKEHEIPYFFNTKEVPFEFKLRIFNLNHSSKILIDNINVYNKYKNYNQILSPVAFTISDNSKYNIPKYDLVMIQKHKDSAFRTYQEPIQNDNYQFQIESGILKFYNAQFLISEQLIKKHRLIWKKEYYKNGTLKEHISFEHNDSLGKIKRYYENGALKAEGQVIEFKPNIYKSYRIHIPDLMFKSDYNTLDSFLICEYAPYGRWKGYFANGKLALDCDLKLHVYNQISEFINNKDHNAIGTSIGLKTAFENKDTFYIPFFNGPYLLLYPNGKKR